MPTSISRGDLHHLMTNGHRPVLVEALGAAYYADAHLPGAVNIPPGHVYRLAPALLPDRKVRIVVYCTGAWTSAAAEHWEPDVDIETRSLISAALSVSAA